MTDLDCLPFLKIANSHLLHQFLHECVDDLINKQIVNYDKYSSHIDCSKEEFDNAKKFLQNLYSQSANQELVIQSSSLSDNLKEAITKCCEIRKKDIYQALVKEALLKNGCNLVENIDWKLKWILGSSDLASLREPLLQIDFYYNNKESNKTVRRIANFEVNLGQVDTMIKELTRIKQELE